MELNKKNVRKILLIITFTILLFLVAQNIGSVASGVKTVIGYFSPVITGLFLAFALNILLSALEKHVFAFMKKSKRKLVRKLCRPICLILSLIIILGIIVIMIVGIIPEFIELFTSLSNTIPDLAGDAVEWIEAQLQHFNIASSVLPNYTINWEKLFDTILNFLGDSSGNLVGGAFNATASIVTGAFNVLFSIVIAVYIVAQKEKVGRFTVKLINAIIPKKYAKMIFRLSTLTYSAFSNFISGQLLESSILGILCFIGSLIIGVPNSAIISITIAITSIVPIVGAFVGIVIGTVLILIESPIKALFFLIFILALQQVEGSLIYPKVVGKSVGLPGLIVFCAVLVGGNIGGVLGALFAVPIATVIFTLLKELIEKKPAIKIPLKKGKSEPSIEIMNKNNKS